MADQISIVDTTGNPAPLGLMGFGMTTVLLNLHNAGIIELSAMILAMGIFYGGVAQVIAGCMEWKKKNTFATTAFTSYGLFWMTLVALLIMPHMNLGGAAAAVSDTGLAAYLFMWGLFTLFMYFGTKGSNKVLRFVFLSLVILFFLLALRDWTGSGFIGAIAGFEGIICGFSAFYLAMAELLNEKAGRTVWPIGE